MIRYRRGAYEVVVYAGPDPVTGKQRRVSRSVRIPEQRRTPADVKALEARLIAEVGAGQHGSPHVTVGELLDRWIAHVRDDLSPLTLRGYERTIRLYLRPSLGNVKLAKLTTDALDRLYRHLTERGGADGAPLAPATVRQAHAVLRRALHQAQRWGWVAINVAALADPPSIRRTPIQPPDPATFARILAAARADDGELGLLVALAGATGCRRGELCGLRWADLDLDGGSLVVRRAVIDLPDRLVVKAPKTRPRSVALGPRLVAELRARRVRAVEVALACGVPLHPDAYVLSESVDGQAPLHPKLASDRFRRLVTKLGLKVRLHDLRHAAVTWALQGGAAVNDVAAHVGHASPKMTLDTYGHAMPAGQRRVAEILDAGLG